MSWSEERWGSDRGYRSGEYYVGSTPRKFWRLWIPGRDLPIEEVFRTHQEARAYAEMLKRGEAA